jgi:cupin 2 domain-containing protein
LIDVKNLYNTPCPEENHETFSTLFENRIFKIEAINSWLKKPGEAYYQEQDEWVLLLEGDAELELNHNRYTLQRGDYLFIPKHTPHTVLWTSKNTRWIGIFSS